MCETKIKNAKTSPVASDAEATDHGSIEIHQPVEPIINFDHGDPTMYESYWQKLGEDFKLTITGYQSLSYFANKNNLCWFLEPKLEAQIKILHNLVGNAIVEDRYIVVGNGSNQLVQAALYAVSTYLNQPDPISVVAAAPYYSPYPEITNHLRSGLFKWGGDANSYTKNGPYIEIVTSPNNPDGAIREAVVNGDEGKAIHDFAYYWPQYTAISSPADHEVMLFTASKCTGHAGSRIGWAIVKDNDIAKRMVKFMEINTIGVSKEAQLRAATILEFVSASCQGSVKMSNFFEYSQNVMTKRWKKLRDAVKKNEVFQLPNFLSQYCTFNRDRIEPHPAFAWVKCKEGTDCAKLLKEHKILTRGGRLLGSGLEYARISMMSRDDEFDLFVQRLQTIDALEN